MPGTWTLTLPAPEFVETVNSHGWRSLAPFSWDGTKLTRIERLPDGLVVRIQMDGEGYTVEPPADVSSVVARMLNLHFDLAAFYRFARQHRELAHIPRRRQGRLLRSPSLFEDVVKTILTTNTTWNITKAMARRLVDLLGEPWTPDPTWRAFPTPLSIAAGDLSPLKLGYRAGYVARFAERVASGALDLNLIENLPPAARTKAFLEIDGIGPYGAAHLAVLLNDFSAVPVDSWARMILGRKLGRPVTDAEVRTHFEPYGQWRYLAYRFFDWDKNIEWW